MSRHTRRHWLAGIMLLLATVMAAIPFQAVLAMIEGGDGNAPINDPGWPKGAAAIVNHPARIAWWVGPPFGGGQWTAEYRGDTAAFKAVLANFAVLDVKTKRIVIHDGVGTSFWLNPNREAAKKAASKMDWSFMVWQPVQFTQLGKLPADLNPIDAGNAGDGPPSQIDVYTGGAIHWADVKIPEGITVDDQRMEAHGFTPADGVVLEGKVTDLATKLPLAARVQLQNVEPQKTGGYTYPVVSEAAADAQGHWVVKNTPAGWLRVVVAMDGYVPRVAGYGRFDDQPVWHTYACGLSKPAPVSGRVVDDAGQPLAGVDVRIGDVAADGGGRYESPDDYAAKTGADGRFHVDSIPIGSASVWINKPGYCHEGLGPTIRTPNSGIALAMKKSAQLIVTVDFAKMPRPDAYIVNLSPEGGDVIGSWGGSGNINAKNQMVFENVPAGRYVVNGQPNPSGANQHSKSHVLDLKGGETTEFTLPAELPPDPNRKPAVKPPAPKSNDTF